MRKTDKHFGFKLFRHKGEIQLVILMVFIPLAIQLLYSIPLMNPKVSADTVLQFCGVIVGLSFAAKTAYYAKRAEALVNQEIDMRNRIMSLLEDIQKNKFLILSSSTGDKLMQISYQGANSSSSICQRMHATIKKFADEVLGLSVAYNQADRRAFYKAFDTHVCISSDGETGEAQNYDNPEEVYEVFSNEINSFFMDQVNELHGQVDTLRREINNCL